MNRVFNWVGIILICIALLSALSMGAYFLSQSEKEADRKSSVYQKQQFILANTICGAQGAIDIDPQNAAWNHRAWIKVTCQDGTVKAVTR